MPRRKLLHSHPVSRERLWSTAWSSGVTSVFWSFFLGIWIVRHHAEMFDSETWVVFLDTIGGRKWIIGLIILIGGASGLAGLAFRIRLLSLVSCVIGILWCAWIAAFLAFAPANMGAPFAALACSVFVHRFVLLVSPPGAENDVGLRR